MPSCPLKTSSSTPSPLVLTVFDFMLTYKIIVVNQFDTQHYTRGFLAPHSWLCFGMFVAKCIDLRISQMEFQPYPEVCCSGG